jgi:hypothetical protein
MLHEISFREIVLGILLVFTPWGALEGQGVSLSLGVQEKMNSTTIPSGNNQASVQIWVDTCSMLTISIAISQPVMFSVASPQNIITDYSGSLVQDSDGFYECNIIVPNPGPGKWTLAFSLAGPLTIETQIATVTTFTNPTVFVAAFAPTDPIHLGQSVPLNLIAMDTAKNTYLTNLQATVAIVGPIDSAGDLGKLTYSVVDDGSDPDGIAGNGQFGVSVANLPSGDFGADFEIDGIHPNGQHFSRSCKSFFHIVQNRAHFQGDISYRTTIFFPSIAQ